MTDILTVVAAVDDDEGSLDALRLAQFCAQTAEGGRLFAAHAAPPIPAALEAVLFPFACFGDDYDALRAELVQVTTRRLGKRIKSVVPQASPEMLRVASGVPHNALLDIAANLGPDLIVAGTTRHAGGDAWWLGRVVSALARRSPVPFAVARPLKDAEPSLARIIAAVDLTDDSPQTLEYALQLALRSGGQVQAVFVAPGRHPQDHAGLADEDRGVATRQKKEIAQRWEKLQATLELSFPVARELGNILRPRVVISGDPGERLAAIAREHEADAVVIGRSRRGTEAGARLGRVAEHVLRHAPAHVFVVPYRQHEETN